VIASLDPAPDYLVVSGSLPPEVPADYCATLVKHAPEKTRVVLDTSGEALRHALKAGAFMVKPNLRELSDLVGRELRHDPDIDDAVRELTRGSSQHVVVSLGAGGALMATPKEIIRVRSPTVPIRSKVGAGDSMVGGIVLALSRGMDMKEALKFGVAAGAAAVMTPGTELCRREDAERLYGCMSEGR
jgi:6-phosphofructokinase 2